MTKVKFETNIGEYNYQIKSNKINGGLKMKRYEVIKWGNGYNIADNKYLNVVLYDSALTKEEAEEFAEEYNNNPEDYQTIK